MLFAKVLAIIYLSAFVSCAVQIKGLIGSSGIAPISEFVGATSWAEAPTVFRWMHSDVALGAVCWTGAAVAVFAALARAHGWLQRSAFAVLFFLYLSLVTAGQIFMGYQWDYLLLETGFLAIFLTPDYGRVWLFQWLLFRLMFESGLVKLTSHDATWRNLTALSFHYETQPLPTPLAWFAEQWPMNVQKFSTAMVFVMELLFPFLIFGPRRWKQIAAFGIAGLQLLILLTGNYTFFNWLSIALCLLLLDDRFLRSREAVTAVVRGNRFVTVALFLFVMVLGAAQLAEMSGSGNPPVVLRRAQTLIAPYGLVNSYGLFASMTTSRPEIEVEGSNDGEVWKPYIFRYKAGPLNRAPAWVAPYQPRLDWQMWFAALGNYPENPWFGQFLLRILQGSEPVLRLMAQDPFGGKPPKFVRATEYEYHFTDWETRRRTGAWWKREWKGTYFPAVALK